MNFQTTYRHLQMPISPSPALIRHTLDTPRRRSRLLGKLAAAGIAAVIVFGYIFALIFKPGAK